MNNAKERCWVLGFSILILYRIAGGAGLFDGLNTLENMILCVGITFLLITILYTPQTRTSVISLLLLSSMGILSYLGSGETIIGICFLIIVSAKEIPDEVVIQCYIKIVGWTLAVVFILNWVLYYLGMVEPYYVSSDGRWAFTFFLGAKNAFSNYLLWILVADFVNTCKKNHLGIENIIKTVSAAGIMFFLQSSKANACLAILACILFFAAEYLPRSLKKVLGACTQYAELIITISTLSLTLLFTVYCVDDFLYTHLYSTLYSRFASGNKAFLTFGSTLFGQGINYADVPSFYVRYGKITGITIDSFYMKSLVSYGVIALAAFNILYWNAIKRINRQREYYKSAALLLVAVILVVDLLNFLPVICWPLIFLKDAFRENTTKAQTGHNYLKIKYH